MEVILIKAVGSGPAGQSLIKFSAEYTNKIITKMKNKMGKWKNENQFSFDAAVWIISQKHAVREK